DTLAQAGSKEDPGKIANAIARSIGRGLSGYAEEQNDVNRRIPQRTTSSKNTEQSRPQTALLRAWRVFLESLTQQQPLIIVIDDLQWADEALLDLLEYLVTRITNVPILFLCPARPDFYERRRDWGRGQSNFL